MELRASNVDKLRDGYFDVLILGGGINGAVSAASLAAKGVKVALVDKDDFAGLTSSNSSNLAWGGIKYLENHEYFLVDKLCRSRNHLMRSYPSTVKEIRFLTTIQKGFRFPAFIVYLGTILYWIIGRFVTRAPKYLSPAGLSKRDGVIDTSSAVGGFEYSDCYLYDNDARFVFNFIRTSLNYGGIAANYVESIGAQRKGGLWHTQLKDTISGETFSLRSRVLINACGPYVDDHNQLTGQHTEHRHLFSKGIHLIVDRITETQRILTFFASDGRLFFVIPMGPKTCIGTTDTQEGSPEVEVLPADRQFVLDNVNALLKLKRPLTVDDVIAERCGVRPLALKGQDGVADWVKLSRKHAIDVDNNNKHLSIFGGKLTDCLNVGDEVSDIVAKLGVAVPYATKRWYGEPGNSVKEEFMHQAILMGLDEMTDRSSSEPLSQRLWRRYGRSAIEMLEMIREDPSCAELLIENSEYLRCEIEHAARREMITKLEDFLRRRSKIALVVRREDIINAPGLKEACQILFGDEAEAKLQEYIEATAAS
ncbi:Glycerol-3-phosphate dehydrogenase 2 [Zhongshania aliphaticivorans]|uniref:Glycerol-3-phosphate dehydrogenase 2 n=1 Tax=Zhongshania aliphaticivorans TaxID=1470434 RepID=A0A5S9QG74_9GAMM|nr:glycerol-3-phosphate dehydrogenase/oxidase [Zhongshania aliphaticivorans]CAA0109346.1 Glycerol-3-phosphate dehydrogenase 2 [Zhongshania aliphaticivorans]CAA0117575.1 Glycerol-3-phosphate dehydrogenase 2 [Zhongshania aliphaticivorans]